MMRSVPEPLRDIAAQLDMLFDPRSSRDAVFLSPGTPEPPVAGVHRIERPEGVLLTTNDMKAHIFRKAGRINDLIMALLLDYPESKTEVLRSTRRGEGPPVVVQAIAANGGVAYEAACSPRGLQRTVRAAYAAVPDGVVRQTTLEGALSDRAEEYANGA